MISVNFRIFQLHKLYWGRGAIFKKVYKGIIHKVSPEVTVPFLPFVKDTPNEKRKSNIPSKPFNFFHYSLSQ